MRRTNIDRRVCQLLAEACQTFTHPKRVEIINLLREGEKSVGEIVDALGIAKANVSQHLAILRQRGAVAYRREGQTLHYRLANPKIIKACDLMKEVLLERLAEGERLVERARGRRARR
jgi:DNA-binding transcriptional ArsR family regulator